MYTQLYFTKCISESLNLGGETAAPNSGLRYENFLVLVHEYIVPCYSLIQVPYGDWEGSWFEHSVS